MCLFVDNIRFTMFLTIQSFTCNSFTLINAVIDNCSFVTKQLKQVWETKLLYLNFLEFLTSLQFIEP